MVSTRGVRYKFSEGERVLCYEPDPTKAKVLYDSKVLEVIENKDKRGRRTIEYLIHFQGWNSSWDRCVGEDFVLKDTEENRQLQRDLAEKAQLQLGAYLYRRERKKGSTSGSAGSSAAKRSRHRFSDDGSSSSTQPDEPENEGVDGDPEADAENSQESPEEEIKEEIESDSSESSENEPRANAGSPGDHVPVPVGRAHLTLPAVLRDRLTFDYHLIVKRNRLTRLPASPCAAQILESFVKWFARAGAWHTPRCRNEPPQKPDLADVSRRLNLVREVADGMRVYFDFIMRGNLLYKPELAQYHQVCGQFLDQQERKMKEELESDGLSQDEYEQDIGSAEEDMKSPKIPEYSHLPPDPVQAPDALNGEVMDFNQIKQEIKEEPEDVEEESEMTEEIDSELQEEMQEAMQQEMQGGMEQEQLPEDVEMQQHIKEEVEDQEDYQEESHDDYQGDLQDEIQEQEETPEIQEDIPAEIQKEVLQEVKQEIEEEIQEVIKKELQEMAGEKKIHDEKVEPVQNEKQEKEIKDDKKIQEEVPLKVKEAKDDLKDSQNLPSTQTESEHSEHKSNKDVKQNEVVKDTHSQATDLAHVADRSPSEGHHSQSVGHHSRSEGHHSQSEGHHSQSEGHHSQSEDHHSRSEDHHNKSEGHHTREGLRSQTEGHHSQSEGHHTREGLRSRTEVHHSQSEDHHSRSEGHHSQSEGHHTRERLRSQAEGQHSREGLRSHASESHHNREGLRSQSIEGHNIREGLRSQSMEGHHSPRSPAVEDTFANTVRKDLHRPNTRSRRGNNSPAVGNNPPVVGNNSPAFDRGTNSPGVQRSNISPNIQKGNNSSSVQKSSNSPSIQNSTNTPSIQKSTNCPSIQKSTNTPSVQKSANCPSIQKGANSPSVQRGNKSPTTQKSTIPSSIQRGNNSPSIQKGNNSPSVQQDNSPAVEDFPDRLEDPENFVNTIRNQINRPATRGQRRRWTNSPATPPANEEPQSSNVSTKETLLITEIKQEPDAEANRPATRTRTRSGNRKSINSPAANSPAVNSPAVDSPAVDSPAVNSPAVNSPAINSPAVNSSEETPECSKAEEANLITEIKQEPRDLETSRPATRSGNVARRLRSHKSAVSQSENEEPQPSTSAAEPRHFEHSSSVCSGSGSSNEEWSKPAEPAVAPAASTRTPLSLLLDKVSKYEIIPRDGTEHLPCRVYGAIHLARLFVRLPDFLNATQMSDFKLKLIVKHIDMFIEYLVEHKEWFGEKFYYCDSMSRST